jgi:predicted dinucleotide-binding enzyme
MNPPSFDDRPLVVPLCGNDQTAKDTDAALTKDLACTPLDIGPLHCAPHLEAMAAVVIGLLLSGADPVTVFDLVDAGSAPRA